MYTFKLFVWDWDFNLNLGRKELGISLCVSVIRAFSFSPPKIPASTVPSNETYSFV
jgi:hypothetical protein